MSILSVVSVDVLALVYDPDSMAVSYGAPRRIAPPFEGQPALPGVVLTSGERLDSAARRAIRKLTSAEPLALGQLRTFDEPSRDPRGPSLSVAMWAALPAGAAGEFRALPAPVEGEGPLAFDHDDIVLTCLPMLAEMLWRDLTFTRALLPQPFTTRDALAVSRALTGVEPHRGNLNRTLDQVSDVVGTHVAGRGRPSAVRRFRGP